MSRNIKTFLFVLVFASAVLAQGEVYESASVEVDGCSGTLIAIGPRWTYGLSAAHCASVGKAIKVHTFKGKEFAGTWVSKDAKTDLALFRIPSDPSLTAVQLGRVTDAIQGFGRNGKKELRHTTIGAIEDRTNGARFERAEYIVESGKFDNGDSGGGVFSNGKLCGVISHGEKKKLYAATRLQILSFVAEQKSLKHSVETTTKEWGDKDRTREIVALKRELQDLKQQIQELKSSTGKTGPAGPPGPMGNTGPAGPPGRDGMSVSGSAYEERLHKIEEWIKSFRAVVRVKLITKGE